MWFLKSHRDGALFHLVVGKTHTINRKGGDLVLGDDQSISRKHGAILVSEEGEIFLWDEGSKYGTYIYKGSEEQKLPENERTKIKVGDRIRFGLQWNMFVLCKTDLLVCTSSLTGEENKTLQMILPKLGGKLSKNWNDQCTHLTMNRVSLTQKVVLALADAKPIVTVTFWQKMQEAITNHSILPRIEDYQPSVVEEELQKQTEPNTLLPNKERKTLFRGKIFVFFSEDHKFKSLAERAGGLCKSVQSSKLSPKECCESNYVVIKDGDASVQVMRDIFSALKKKGLRSIDVSEIALAIYNNSLVRYCNPYWRRPAILGSSPSQSQGVCLVQDTEDIGNTQNMKVESGENIVIPPSLSSVASDTSLNSSIATKRPLSHTDSRPTKRLALGKTTSQAGPQRSESDKSTSKESEATQSLDISLDMFGSLSQRARKEETPRTTDGDYSFIASSSKRNNEGKNGKADDGIFKVPSPKKSTKRGRAENDPSELPLPKRTAAQPKPGFHEKVESLNTNEENSYEEADVSQPSRKKKSHIPSSPTEADTDDMFESHAFKNPAHRKDDEPSNKTAVAGINTIIEKGRPSTSRLEEAGNNRRSGPVGDGKAPKVKSNDSTRSNISETSKNITHTPSLSQFIDKSVGVAIKKEEGEIDEEVSKMMIKVKIAESSLLRERPPLRVLESSNSVIAGRPNFKKFRKSFQRRERPKIDLIVDHNIQMYEGVPERDPDIPTTNGSIFTEEESLEDMFPSTNTNIQENRRNRQSRRETQIVDEWTLA